jgi:hypothetical protein
VLSQQQAETEHTMKAWHKFTLYFKVQEDGKIFISKSFVISAVYQI